MDDARGAVDTGLEIIQYGIQEGEEIGLFPEDWRQTRTLYSPSARQEYYSPNTIEGDLLEDVQVNSMQGGLAIWRIKPSDALSEVSSIKEERDQELAVIDLNKTKHELCAELISGKYGSDVKLWRHFGVIGDMYDTLSPDHIVTIDNYDVVIEVTTRRNNAEIHRAYDGKRASYTDALSHRLGERPMVYWIIVVTHDTVLSSFPLLETTVRELITRYLVGRQIEAKAAEMGHVMIETDRYDQKIMNALKTSITKVRLSDTSGLGITEETLTRNRQYFPGNQNYTATVVINCLDRCARDETSLAKEIDLAKKESEILKGKVNSGEGKRSDCKNVVQIPLIIPAFKKGIIIDRSYPAATSKDPAVIHLWSDVMQMMQLDEQFEYEDLSVLLEEAYMDNDELLEEFEKSRKAQRRKWHRVKLIDISPEVRREAALDGLWGKQFKTERWMSDRHNDQKDTFSMDAPVDDITELLSRLPYKMDSMPIAEDPAIFLLKTANDLMHNSQEGLGKLQELMATDIYHGLSLIASIAAELTLSLKQNVTTKEFILKKIRDLDVLMIVHPTNSRSHIFFSLRFGPGSKIIEEGVFRRLIRHGSYYYTDILSVNSCRLENWLICPQIWLNAVIQWTALLSPGKEAQGYDCFDNVEVARMSWLVLVLALEDKHTSEAIVSNTRYIFMELFKSTDKINPPRVSKVYSKFPTCLRSRFQVFLLSSILGATEEMLTNLPTLTMREEGVTEQDVRGDHWLGLINPYTRSQVGSAKTMIELAYLGYVVNVETPRDKNKEYQLVNKILKANLNLRPEKERIYSGAEDPPAKDQPGPHEFSRTMMAEACEIMTERIKKTHGRGWKDRLSEEILYKLSHDSDFSEIATMKASAVLAGPNAKATHSKVSCSRKCVEAVVDELKESGIFPVMDLKGLVDGVYKEMKGVSCYIFPKDQHAGIREIYVMTIKSRCVQLFVETCAKAVCQHFPEESMTHPENKLRMIDEHFTASSISAASHGGKLMTRISSEDKSQWSQNLEVQCMMFMVAKLFPDWLHEPLVACLELWLTKKVQLPQGVQEMLLNRVKKKDDPTYDILMRAFHDELTPEDPYLSDQLFERRGNRSMKIRSGMWQGVLHYFSSLQHVAQTLHYRQCVSRYLKPSMTELGCFDLKMSTMVSSDDSMTLMTAVVSDALSDEELAKIDHILLKALELETEHCRSFQMISSEKTVIGSKNVGEYNSNFVFRGGLINGVGKIINATARVREAETFKKRQETAYNSISDLVESGCTHYQAHLHQMVQGLVFYGGLGKLVSPFFTEWSESISRCPEPALGFFLLDADIICGLPGYRYSCWVSLVQTNMPLVVSFPTAVRADEQCLITTSFILQYGNRARWKRLIANVAVKDWYEKIEENPELLYIGRAKTVEDLRLILSKKVTSHGVYESLRSGGSVVNAFSSSIYCLSTRSITIKEIDMVEKDGDGSLKRYECKRSLLWLTRDANSILDRNDGRGIGAEKNSLISTLFPSASMYIGLTTAINKLRMEAIEEVCPHYRRRKNVIELTSTNTSCPASLLDTVKYKWFGITARCAHCSVEASWLKYQELYGWLRGTPADTLEASPFSNHCQLSDFISGVLEKRSCVRPLSRKLITSDTISQMVESARFNHYPGVSLSIPRLGQLDEDKDPRLNLELGPALVNLVNLKSKVDLLLNSPFDASDKSTMLSLLVSDSGPSVSLIDMPLISKSLWPICVIKKMHGDEKVDKELLVKSLLRLNGGRFVYFRKAQEFDEKEMSYSGFGVAEMVFEGNLRISLYLLDSNCYAITTNDIDSARRNVEAINECLAGWKMGICRIARVEDSQRGEVPRQMLDGVRPDYCFDSMKILKVLASNKPNIPIFDMDVRGPPPHLSLAETKIVTTDYSIRIVTTIKGYRKSVKDRDVTLFSYRPSRNAGLPAGHDSKDIETSPLRAWVEGHSLDPNVALRNLIELYKKRDSLSVSEVSMMSWYKSSLRTRLVGLRKLESVSMISEDKPICRFEDDDDRVDLGSALRDSVLSSIVMNMPTPSMFEPMLKIQSCLEGPNSDLPEVEDWTDNEPVAGCSTSEPGPSKEVGKPKPDVVELSSFGMSEEILELSKKLSDALRLRVAEEPDARGNLQSPSISMIKLIRPKVKSVYHNHPFWDEFIQYLTDNGDLWSIIVKKGKCPKELESTLKLVEWVLGVNLGLEILKPLVLPKDLDSLNEP